MWIDGRILRGAEATLSVFDRGARDGEGLFETVLVRAGQPVFWERHLERLVLSAAELGFPVPASPLELRDALDQVLGASALEDAVARLTVTRGIPGSRPTRSGAWVDVEPLAARLWRGTRRGHARAIRSCVPFEPGWIGRHKTTSRLAYHLAREEARAVHADEALLVTPAGEALEGAVSNLFALSDDELRTPPLSANVLPGIVRAWVLRAARTLGLSVREAPLPASTLAGFDELLLTNSVQGIVTVSDLDGVAIPGFTLGERLRARYAQALASGEA